MSPQSHHTLSWCNLLSCSHIVSILFFFVAICVNGGYAWLSAGKMCFHVCFPVPEPVMWSHGCGVLPTEMNPSINKNPLMPEVCKPLSNWASYLPLKSLTHRCFKFTLVYFVAKIIWNAWRGTVSRKGTGTSFVSCLFRLLLLPMCHQESVIISPRWMVHMEESPPPVFQGQSAMLRPWLWRDGGS